MLINREDAGSFFASPFIEHDESIGWWITNPSEDLYHGYCFFVDLLPAAIEYFIDGRGWASSRWTRGIRRNSTTLSRTTSHSTLDVTSSSHFFPAMDHFNQASISIIDTCLAEIDLILVVFAWFTQRSQSWPFESFDTVDDCKQARKQRPIFKFARCQCKTVLNDWHRSRASSLDEKNSLRSIGRWFSYSLAMTHRWTTEPIVGRSIDQRRAT